jgi:diacylglycerol kinase family enzyme
MEQVNEIAALVAPSEPARAIPVAAKALVFFNDKAGSVGPKDRERLVEALGACDIGQYALIDAKKISRKLFQRADEFDVIIVLGGDGTARAAAELAPRDGPPLVLLPGGTLNVLPRALYGDLAWPEALKAALERGEVRRLPMARANDKTFYVAAMFGNTALFARAREAVREGKPLTAWRRFRVALRRSFSRSLRARHSANGMEKVEAVGVLLPTFSGGLEADDIEWVRLEARHLLDLARIGVRALTSSWRKDPSIEICRCKTGDIEARFGVVYAVLDGEPHTFMQRVHLKYDPRGPRVLALEQEEDKAG